MISKLFVFLISVGSGFEVDMFFGKWWLWVVGVFWFDDVCGCFVLFCWVGEMGSWIEVMYWVFCLKCFLDCEKDSWEVVLCRRCWLCGDVWGVGRYYCDFWKRNLIVWGVWVVVLLCSCSSFSFVIVVKFFFFLVWEFWV